MIAPLLYRVVLAAVALGLLAGAYGVSGRLDRALRRHPDRARWLFWVPAGLATLLVVALSGGLDAAFGALGSGVSGEYNPVYWVFGLGVSAVLHLGLVLAPMAWREPGRWTWLAALALLAGAISYGALAYSAFTAPGFDLYIMEMGSAMEGSPGPIGPDGEFALEIRKMMIQMAAFGVVVAGVSLLNALGILLVFRARGRSSIRAAVGAVEDDVTRP